MPVLRARKTECRKFMYNGFPSTGPVPDIGAILASLPLMCSPLFRESWRSFPGSARQPGSYSSSRWWLCTRPAGCGHGSRWKAIATPRDVREADVVVFCRNVRPDRAELLHTAIAAGVPVLYDLDDNFFETPARSAVGTAFAQPRARWRCSASTLRRQAWCESIPGRCWNARGVESPCGNGCRRGRSWPGAAARTSRPGGPLKLSMRPAGWTTRWGRFFFRPCGG